MSDGYSYDLYVLDTLDTLEKKIAVLEAENAKLRADIVELTRKGETLCCQNGNLLMDNAKLHAVVEAASSVCSEPEVREFLLSYVQGARLLELLEGEK